MTAETRLTIRALADPQTMPRLLNCIAQLGAVPRRVVAESIDGLFDVIIVPDGLNERQIDIIAEKMRASVLVESVRVTCSDVQPTTEGLS